MDTYEFFPQSESYVKRSDSNGLITGIKPLR